MGLGRASGAPRTKDGSAHLRGGVGSSKQSGHEPCTSSAHALRSRTSSPRCDSDGGDRRCGRQLSPASRPERAAQQAGHRHQARSERGLRVAHDVRDDGVDPGRVVAGRRVAGRGATTVDPAIANPTLDEISAQFVSRGYQRVTRTEGPDFGVAVTAVSKLNAVTVSYGGWWGAGAASGSYWGYSGSGLGSTIGYSSVVVWQSGTLIIELYDLRAARDEARRTGVVPTLAASRPRDDGPDPGHLGGAPPRGAGRGRSDSRGAAHRGNPAGVHPVAVPGACEHAIGGPVKHTRVNWAAALLVGLAMSSASGNAAAESEVALGAAFDARVPVGSFRRAVPVTSFGGFQARWDFYPLDALATGVEVQYNLFQRPSTTDTVTTADGAITGTTFRYASFWSLMPTARYHLFPRGALRPYAEIAAGVVGVTSAVLLSDLSKRDITTAFIAQPSVGVLWRVWQPKPDTSRRGELPSTCCRCAAKSDRIDVRAHRERDVHLHDCGRRRLEQRLVRRPPDRDLRETVTVDRAP